MKKILVLSSLAVVLTGCSTGGDSEKVKSKVISTTEAVESKSKEDKTTATEETKKETKVSISLDSKDFSAYVGEYVPVDKNLKYNKMMVESDGTLRNSLLEPSKFQIIEESGKKYFISSTHVVRIPTKYNLVPAGTQPASGFDTKEKSDSSKHRIFIKSEGSNEVGVYEKVGTSSSSKPDTTTSSDDKKESAPKTNSSLTEAQSEALAKGMKTFGEKMNQIPYEKTDVPDKLTWQSGGDVEGYKIFESYIYKSGGTTHRYFFAANSNGTPEVLYSTGGTSVKNTANADIVAMFKGVYGGGSSSENKTTKEASTSSGINYSDLEGTYVAADGETMVIEKYKDGVKYYNQSMSRDKVVTYWGGVRKNGNEVIEFEPKNPGEIYPPSSHSFIPAGTPTPADYKKMGAYKSSEDDENKDRLVLVMPGMPAEAYGKIYLKEGETSNNKEENTSNKSSKSKLDLDAIAKGDLSSAAGTHSFGSNKVVITKNSITVGNKETNLSNFAKKDGVASVRVALKDRSGLGMSSGENDYYFVPAGMPNPFIAPNADTAKILPNVDINRDRVIIIVEMGVVHFYLD